LVVFLGATFLGAIPRGLIAPGEKLAFLDLLSDAERAPGPARTTQRTSGSPATLITMSRNDALAAASRPFKVSGRSNLTVATPSAKSSTTGVLRS
jgi:hypothetical protein